MAQGIADAYTPDNTIRPKPRGVGHRVAWGDERRFVADGWRRLLRAGEPSPR